MTTKAIVVGALLVGFIGTHGCAAPAQATTVTREATLPPPPPPPNPEVVPVATAQDACAQFNQAQQNRLSDDEHMKRYGCPPCPCACSNGRIVCAPCARCEAFGPRGPRHGSGRSLNSKVTS